MLYHKKSIGLRHSLKLLSITQLNSKFSIVFLWSFAVLLWIPYIVVDIILGWATQLFPDFGRAVSQLLHDLLRLENGLIFGGHHFPTYDVAGIFYTDFDQQTLVASLILALIFGCIAVSIDHYRPFLLHFRKMSYPLLYSLIAKLLALDILLPGLGKVFLSHFFCANYPELQMTPAGSIDTGKLFFFAYGTSNGYQFTIGVLELLAVLLLWIPRTVLAGAILFTILMTNILLMDYFCGPDVVFICCLLLAGSWFLLMPEIKHYAHHFFNAHVDEHSTPIYSFRTPHSSANTIKFLRVTSITFLISYTLALISAVNYPQFHEEQRILSDPMYGVWDNSENPQFIGRFNMNSLGIVRIKNNESTYALVSVLSYGRAHPVENITGLSTGNSIEFSLINDDDKQIEITVDLIDNNDLVAYYVKGTSATTLHYHHRALHPALPA